jgi:hypothetical protein
MTPQEGFQMDWRLEPIILPLLIATLLTLATPRAAHPQSQELIDACSGDAMRLCPAQVAAAMAGVRKPIGKCMHAHWAELSEQCRAAARAERKAGRP